MPVRDPPPKTVPPRPSSAAESSGSYRDSHGSRSGLAPPATMTTGGPIGRGFRSSPSTGSPRPRPDRSSSATLSSAGRKGVGALLTCATRAKREQEGRGCEHRGLLARQQAVHLGECLDLVEDLRTGCGADRPTQAQQRRLLPPDEQVEACKRERRSWQLGARRDVCRRGVDRAFDLRSEQPEHVPAPPKPDLGFEESGQAVRARRIALERRATELEALLGGPGRVPQPRRPFQRRQGARRQVCFFGCRPVDDLARDREPLVELGITGVTRAAIQRLRV